MFSFDIPFLCSEWYGPFVFPGSFLSYSSFSWPFAIFFFLSPPSGLWCLVLRLCAMPGPLHFLILPSGYCFLIIFYLMVFLAFLSGLSPVMSIEVPGISSSGIFVLVVFSGFYLFPFVLPFCVLSLVLPFSWVWSLRQFRLRFFLSLPLLLSSVISIFVFACLPSTGSPGGALLWSLKFFFLFSHQSPSHFGLFSVFPISRCWCWPSFLCFSPSIPECMLLR